MRPEDKAIPCSRLGFAHVGRGKDGSLPEPNHRRYVGGHNLKGKQGLQRKTGGTVKLLAYNDFTSALDALPEEGRPSGSDDPHGGVKLRK